MFKIRYPESTFNISNHDIDLGPKDSTTIPSSFYIENDDIIKDLVEVSADVEWITNIEVLSRAYTPPWAYTPQHKIKVKFDVTIPDTDPNLFNGNIHLSYNDGELVDTVVVKFQNIKKYDFGSLQSGNAGWTKQRGKAWQVLYAYKVGQTHHNNYGIIYKDGFDPAERYHLKIKYQRSVDWWNNWRAKLFGATESDFSRPGAPFSSKYKNIAMRPDSDGKFKIKGYNKNNNGKNRWVYLRYAKIHLLRET